MTPAEDDTFLGLFLGPKADNGHLLADLLNLVLEDHFRWRRNHFPGDGTPIAPAERFEHAEIQSELTEAVTELCAELRQSFPFHSPRYIGHQQSETSIMSAVGAIAGLLYNSNNLSPQLGVVTVAQELEAAASLLKMLGMVAPPLPPAIDELDAEVLAEYQARLNQPFGWCHLTSGGTTANIEALWCARNVHYRMLAVGAAAQFATADWISDETRSDVDIARLVDALDPVTMLAGTAVTMPDRTNSVLGELCARDLVRLSPDESMHLFERIIIDAGADAEALLELLRRIGDIEQRRWMAERPVVVYTPGTAHYSVSKAVDVLGLSRAAVRLAETSSRHRIDVESLEAQLFDDDAPTPLAIVVVLGTTEEGAFDPLHEIVRLRERLEQEKNQSFWIHVDAAWGGYFASLLRLDDESQTRLPANGNNPRASAAQLNTFLSTEVTLTLPHPQRSGEAKRTVSLSPGSDHLHECLAALPEADSVTVDPHKMGYQHYPCGALAFRRDTARHFVAEAAPYLSRSDPASRFEPLDRLARHDTSYVHKTGAPAPFTLEGSRPSFPATALRLSQRMLPLNQQGHGRVIRAAWRAAQELWQWIDNWDGMYEELHGLAPPYRLHPLSLENDNGRYVAARPDTNLVIFGVSSRAGMSLGAYNALNSGIERHFTISAEAGDNRDSGAQPFFLSSTQFQLPKYPQTTIAPIAEAVGITDFEQAYGESGGRLKVLRAAVMNPYLEPLQRSGRGDLLRSFMWELDAAITHVCAASEGLARHSRAVLDLRDRSAIPQPTGSGSKPGTPSP